MGSVECPVCLNEVEIPEGTRDGDTITCPYCYAELRVHQTENGWEATLA